MTLRLTCILAQFSWATAGALLKEIDIKDKRKAEVENKAQAVCRGEFLKVYFVSFGERSRVFNLGRESPQLEGCHLGQGTGGERLNPQFVNTKKKWEPTPAEGGGG